MQINTLKAVFQPVHLKYEKVTRVLKSPHALWPKSYKLWAALTIYSSMPYTYYPFLLHYNMKKIYALKNIKKKKANMDTVECLSTNQNTLFINHKYRSKCQYP